MGKIPPFVKVSGYSVLYNDTGTFNLYVPEKHFELNVAKYNGDYISLLGIVNYAIEKNGKLGKLHRFYLPTVFECKPSEVEKIRGIKLTKNTDKQDYRVLKFVKNDPIIVSTKTIQDISNVELLINLFIITGNIPNTIPYDKLQDYIIDNMDFNGNNYKVNLQLWGFIISELCRNPNDLTKPFRTSKSNDMNNYKSISIKDLSRMDSPYSAISSENFDESIVNATLSEKESTSPLEKLLTNDYGND